MSAWVNFQELRAQLDFAVVLRHYGVALKVKGEQHQGFCPLPTHQGRRRSPSFSAHLVRGIWQCFGCGAKGNVLDFAVRMEGKDPASSEDVRQVALQWQVALNHQTPTPTPPSGVGRRSPSLPAREKHQEPADGTAASVVNTPLNFELKDLDVSHPYLAGRGFTPETVKHFGLGYCRRGMLKGRVAIPLHDYDGQLVGYAGRLADDQAVGETNPKYRFPGSRYRGGVQHEFRKSRLVYNANAIEAPVPDLIVVEGFPSVWWLWQCGYPNVVALMGASCSDDQARIIADLVAVGGRVWLLPDGDDAGGRCAASALALLAPHRFMRWVKLDQGRQPTDYLREELTALIGGR